MESVEEACFLALFLTNEHCSSKSYALKVEGETTHESNHLDHPEAG